MLIRPRRLRANAAIRNMIKETNINPASLIYPLFIKEGENIKEEIEAMPGQYRYSTDRCAEKIEEIKRLGIRSVLLFGIPGIKDESGSQAYDDEGIVQRAIREIRKAHPDIYIVTDVCMCGYTSHGHCGILKGREVDNDATLPYLARIALSHARAGADMVAPSDMMDFRVHAIRELLDSNGFENIPIMSYSVKYASAFYGPFRSAAGSAPGFGDRKSYQMDIRNRREALREIELDIEEGADILMVKPAMNCLDIIRDVRKAASLPVAAYSVSGEYAMVMAAAKCGAIDRDKIIAEMAVSAYRAGADIYISYFAPEIAEFIRDGLI